MKAPCKDCPAQGCGAYHSECEKYLKWKEEREKVLEEVNRQKSVIANLDQHQKSIVIRRKKQLHGRGGY